MVCKAVASDGDCMANTKIKQNIKKERNAAVYQVVAKPLNVVVYTDFDTILFHCFFIQNVRQQILL